MLIDHTTILIKAGRGGNGCESYEHRGPRKFYPNGGDGGSGGDVIIRASSNVSSLEYFRYKKRFVAKNGGSGGSNNRSGKTAPPLILEVPTGTTIINKKDNFLIRDLAVNSDEVIVVRGGRSGCGNQNNKTARRGREGEELELLLDYKMLSDVALVGLPNSGKSTLLATVTNARVKITEYPFSTSIPQLGVVELEDYTRLVLADIPSLVKGAAEGRGIGNDFLKHMDRCRGVCFIVEPSSEFAESPEEAIKILQDELSIFSADYKKKPFIIAVNKADKHKDAEQIKERLRKKYNYVYNMSLLNKEGVNILLNELKNVNNRAL